MSANVGMSNDSWGENPHRRISKVSAARSLRSGLVGPKPRPQGVGDGQQVDIPAPLGQRLTTVGCRGGQGATRRGSFKLVGRCSNPASLIEKRVRVALATAPQVPGTCAAKKGLTT